LLGQAVEYFLIPESHLVDRVIQTDVEDVFTSQQAVQGQLNHKGRFTDACPGQNRTTTASGDDTFGFLPHEPQGVAEDQIFLQHYKAPLS